VGKLFDVMAVQIRRIGPLGWWSSAAPPPQHPLKVRAGLRQVKSEPAGRIEHLLIFDGDKVIVHGSVPADIVVEPGTNSA
jgi:hypothetical protein